ncbi:hypothetical protein GCM10008927_11920 [Amylibacter ulvae]|uniref:Glycosyltransferase 2-like domain-containing protein n=1 Tax=Paramylibacter ulvae TaxID=1651968 RepID=A0ABQ3CXE5_9RHOB|nr:glycosyltransferase [Amylibacter ulvae]GHA48459.1 hypothetical protein GCM10008927_11920 [Amylibacter ulvae]
MSDTSKISTEIKLGSRLLEEAISDVNIKPDLRDLVGPAADSWDLQFNDLTSLKLLTSKTDKPKICIATEDIVGPVRNGGIGTTYSFLARTLAEQGFDVTILFLRGVYCETGTIDEWIQYYADFGVKFVPIKDYYTEEKCKGASDRWTAPMFNMFRYLQDHHFDMVHVSEWRGSGYLAMLAKSQGLAFQDTHFVVKCSSPWLWNRLYGSHSLRTLDDLDKIFIEQKSVELGDHIIGGSAHLLRWMASQGYALKRDATFVQPNIISIEHLKKIIGDRNVSPGTRVPVDEIVFFGRLEARKGLAVFCDAISNLVQQGVKLPPKISFMGKPGARIQSRPDVDVLDFIKEISQDWPCEIELLTDFQQEPALRYLLSGNRLAVMPSIIENSSLAVYEAAICQIPFVASNSGGSPELVKEEYHDDVLCDPHPVPLARQIERSLENGGVVAECSFDNDKNIETWIQYHHSLSKFKTKPVVLKKPTPKVSVVVTHCDDIAGLKNSLKALEKQDYSNFDVYLVDDGSIVQKAKADLKKITSRFAALNWKYIESPGLDYGVCANDAIARSDAELIYLTRSGNVLFDGALSKLVKVAQTRNLGVVTGFCYDFKSKVPTQPSNAEFMRMPILGNLNYTFFDADSEPLDMMVRRTDFDKVGGFTGDFRILGDEKELYHSIALNGGVCESIPQPLYWRRKLNDKLLALRLYNRQAENIRQVRPFYRYGPTVFRNLLLFSYGMYEEHARLTAQVDKLRKDRDSQRDMKFARAQERDELRMQFNAMKSQMLAANKGAKIPVAIPKTPLDRYEDNPIYAEYDKSFSINKKGFVGGGIPDISKYSDLPENELAQRLDVKSREAEALRSQLHRVKDRHERLRNQVEWVLRGGGILPKRVAQAARRLAKKIVNSKV